MGSESVNKMFQKHLLEEGHLHYGEFMNDLSRLIVSIVFIALHVQSETRQPATFSAYTFLLFSLQIVDFPDKISFYVMGCVSFFKSSRDDIKANAALFTGKRILRSS